MKLATTQQMQALDRAAQTEHGVPSLVLMERAGAGIAREAVAFARRRGPVVVICGRGNNGGDGLVAARHLLDSDIEVTVILLARSSELTPDARANWERLAAMTTRIFTVQDPETLKPHVPVIAGSCAIVDAVLGTGVSRPVTGTLAHVINHVNALKRPVIAADIPSGLSADTGKPCGTAIRASTTVTFGLPKLGLYTGVAERYVGNVRVVDIGIPSSVVDAFAADTELIDAPLVAPLFAPRDPASHKGTYGHVGVVAGSGGKLGAGYLTSMAALRVGAGLTTYYLPESAFAKFDARYAEIMCEAVPDRGRGHFHPDGLKRLRRGLEHASAVALGPALGTHEETRAFQRELLASLRAPTVVDADGLNNMNAAELSRGTAPLVLTPHPGEFSRLCGRSTADVQEERLTLAREFARNHRCILVLKGHHTVIAASDGHAYINTTGNPAMASAGMGDALTGAVAGCIAQGIGPREAAVAAVHVHGLAGDIAAREIGDRGVVASDVIKRLPVAIRALKETDEP